MWVSACFIQLEKCVFVCVRQWKYRRDDLIQNDTVHQFTLRKREGLLRTHIWTPTLNKTSSPKRPNPHSSPQSRTLIRSLQITGADGQYQTGISPDKTIGLAFHRHYTHTHRNRWHALDKPASDINNPHTSSCLRMWDVIKYLFPHWPFSLEVNAKCSQPVHNPAHRDLPSGHKIDCTQLFLFVSRSKTSGERVTFRSSL